MLPATAETAGVAVYTVESAALSSLLPSHLKPFSHAVPLLLQIMWQSRGNHEAITHNDLAPSQSGVLAVQQLFQLCSDARA